MSKSTIICITPVRNERWAIDTFLRTASVWADNIILADQNSGDGSRGAAATNEKVRSIVDSSSNLNEPERRELLMKEARWMRGPRLKFKLDRYGLCRLVLRIRGTQNI
jgi:hypothetical protein